MSVVWPLIVAATPPGTAPSRGRTPVAVATLLGHASALSALLALTPPWGDDFGRLLPELALRSTAWPGCARPPEPAARVACLRAMAASGKVGAADTDVAEALAAAVAGGTLSRDAAAAALAVWREEAGAAAANAAGGAPCADDDDAGAGASLSAVSASAAAAAAAGGGSGGGRGDWRAGDLRLSAGIGSAATIGSGGTSYALNNAATTATIGGPAMGAAGAWPATAGALGAPACGLPPPLLPGAGAGAPPPAAEPLLPGDAAAALAALRAQREHLARLQARHLELTLLGAQQQFAARGGAAAPQSQQ